MLAEYGIEAGLFAFAVFGTMAAIGHVVQSADDETYQAIGAPIQMPGPDEEHGSAP